MIKSFSGIYEFLSNFYSSPFIIKGFKYYTVEHYYQCRKAKNIEDRKMIRTACSPSEAKQLGRRIEIIDNWEQTKELVMEIGLRAKFDQNPHLKRKLILIGSQIIQEGNYWNDKEWGICLKTNKGKNKLGKLLMKLQKE